MHRRINTSNFTLNKIDMNWKNLYFSFSQFDEKFPLSRLDFDSFKI